MDKYREIYKSSIVETDSIFLDSFVSEGMWPIKSLSKQLSNKTQLRSILDEPNVTRLRDLTVQSEPKDAVTQEEMIQRYVVVEERYELVKKLAKAGLIKRDGPAIEVDKQLIERLRQFLKFLKTVDFDQ